MSSATTLRWSTNLARGICRHLFCACDFFVTAVVLVLPVPRFASKHALIDRRVAHAAETSGRRGVRPSLSIYNFAARVTAAVERKRILKDNSREAFQTQGVLVCSSDTNKTAPQDQASYCEGGDLLSPRARDQMRKRRELSFCGG